MARILKSWRGPDWAAARCLEASFADGTVTRTVLHLKAHHALIVIDELAAVYTADRDGLLPVPLFYGEVVEAKLGAENREWTILVKPVQLPSHLTTVQLLRTTLNPQRLAVN